jgi:hypothetical protein
MIKAYLREIFSVVFCYRLLIILFLCLIHVFSISSHTKETNQVKQTKVIFITNGLLAIPRLFHLHGCWGTVTTVTADKVK